MSRQYGCIAFTDDVRRVQEDYGSAAFYDRMRSRAAGAEDFDPLGPREAAFLIARDGFYLSTVSQTGWPYVQFRGGPPGFVSVKDEHTIAWADFRGNLQHVSTGNLAGDHRVSIIAVDYPSRQRLKLLGWRGSCASKTTRASCLAWSWTATTRSWSPPSRSP
jgi:predicted pyridoxine 5'-phosphate oxidase superfamily flavin-nucleotide-binding protein